MSKHPSIPALNADLGEGYGLLSYGDDAAIAPCLDIANIACGFHGGDPLTMAKAVSLAKTYGLKVAAHPSLPDREGFGRRRMELTPDELRASLIYQVGALSGVLRAAGMTLSYMKPHGNLYGMVSRDRAMAEVYCDVAAIFEAGVFVLPGSEAQTVARERNLPAFAEFFADLAYHDASRFIVTKAHAVDTDWVAKRIVRALREGLVDTLDGTLHKLSFDTICVHNDMPNAAAIARAAREAIDGIRQG